MIKWSVLCVWLHLWTSTAAGGSLSASTIGKCCPSGDTLVLDPNGNFACTRRFDVPRELLDLRESTIKGLPKCEPSSHRVQVLLEEATLVPRHEACIEMFHDDATGQDFIVAVHCQGRVGTELVPRIPRIRKCCPGVYDDDVGVCRDDDGGGEAPSFGGNFGSVEFIDVYRGAGAPECSGGSALVDHKVAPEDVYSDDRGISVSILSRDDGTKVVKRNVSIDMVTSCLDTSFSGITLRRCSEVDYCDSNPCIRKCCPDNKIILHKCLDSWNYEDLGFRASLASLPNSSFALDPQNYGLLFGETCEHYYLHPKNESWNINGMGELVVPDYPPFNHEAYCLEIKNFSNYEFTLVPHICLLGGGLSYEVLEQNDRYKYLIRGVLAIISSVFLLATLLVYACLPSLQNLHGKTLMSHIVSLLMAYVFLSMNSFKIEANAQNSQKVDDDKIEICKYSAFMMIFSFESAFFWLNVMCFDIWWTFGGMQGTVSAADKRRTERNRFLVYCAFSWGIALVLTLASGVFDYLSPKSESIGFYRCWYSYESKSEVIFFFVPISVTLVINTGLFISTSHRCGKVKAEIRQMMVKDVKDSKSRKFHSDKTRLTLNMKLFVVMGIPWLLDNFPAYLNHFHKMPGWISEILIVPDVINSLQGLWIFILFVLKPKVYHSLRKRLSNDNSQSKSTSASNARSLQVHQHLREIQKCPSSSTTTLTSNFIVSSTAT